MEKEIAELNQLIRTELVNSGVVEYTSNGLTTRVVQNTTTNYDWWGIQSKIGAANYRRICRQVPDAGLLTEEIVAGRILPSEVAPYISVTNKGEPYIKVTQAKKVEDA